MYRVRIDRIRRLPDNRIVVEYTEARDAQLGAGRSKRGFVFEQMNRTQTVRAMEASFHAEQCIMIALTDWLATADPISSLNGKVVTVDATAVDKVTIA